MARFMAGGVQSAAMNRRPFLLFPAAAVALVLALAVPAAQAWSRHGHQLVGELAERQLSPAVLAEVRTLLADEPEPGLAAIAPWADEIRASGNALGERSKRWHFVNIPGQDCHYLPERDCPDGNCIIGAIQAQQALLADRSQPRQARAEALKFLVHFLGDVHQPMHAGYPHDRGGNGYQIQYRGEGAPEGEGTNLHGVWDYWLLRSAGLDLPTHADRLQAMPAPDTASAVPGPAAQAWAIESCRLIHSEALYPRGHRIGDDYLERYRPLAEQRVRLAAARLAALLEQALAPLDPPAAPAATR